MAAGMKIIQHMRQIRVQRHHVLAHGVPRERPQPLIKGTRVQRIGRVGDDGGKAVFPQQFRQGVRIGGVQRLGAAPPGIAGKKLECVRADGKRLLAHRAVSL